MYHVNAQGVDERMINIHYYYYIMTKHNIANFRGKPLSQATKQHLNIQLNGESYGSFFTV